MRGNPKSLFLPATFEERGACAPFTTPSLALSRVRPDERHGLVLLMPNLGGADGAYVIPWNAVSGVVTMSVHDRALHEEILDRRATTPDVMRGAALKIARTGLAGPRAAAAAEHLVEAEEAQYAETHFLLILQLLSSLGLNAGKLVHLQYNSEEWRVHARYMLSQAGKSLKVDPNLVYDRIGQLARLLTPVGVGTARAKSRSRRLHEGLQKFSAHLSEWSQTDLSDMAPYAAFAAEVAGLTAGIATRTLETLDKTATDVSTVISQWDQRIALPQRAANRLSWLLDGWDLILAMWANVQAEDRHKQRDEIGQITRVLPLIPRGETEWDENEVEKRRELFQRKRNRLTTDWRTGNYDVEMVARIEMIKTRGVETDAGVVRDAR